MEITVRVIQRTPTITITVIEGINEEYFDIEKILKYMRYNLCCDGISYRNMITKKPEIKLLGNHQEFVNKFFMKINEK